MVWANSSLKPSWSSADEGTQRGSSHGRRRRDPGLHGSGACVAPLEPGTTWNAVVAYVLAMQRDLHRELAAAMRSVQGNDAAAAWSLAGLAFLYGVFHAAGPGHGKVVISIYLATHESRLRRGVALSVLSSLLQGATALGAVGLTVAVLDRSFRDAQSTAFALESVSYGLVALLGLFLAFRSGRRLLARDRRRTEIRPQRLPMAPAPVATVMRPASPTSPRRHPSVISWRRYCR